MRKSLREKSRDDIPLKDFIDFDNLDKPEPSNQTKQPKQQGSGAPAATSGSK
jgi:hypothetical protein